MINSISFTGANKSFAELTKRIAAYTTEESHQYLSVGARYSEEAIRNAEKIAIKAKESMQVKAPSVESLYFSPFGLTERPRTSKVIDYFG